jgi:hypothetical protein
MTRTPTSQRRRGGQGVTRLAATQLMALDQVRSLSAECLTYLGTVVRDTKEDTKHRVAAARCVVAHHQWREEYEMPASPERAFFELMGGAAAAATWLAANYDRLQALAAQRAPAKLQSPVDEGSGG